MGDTAMDPCTARGLLMLSLRLRLIPTFSTVDSDTPDTDWDTSGTDTDSDTDSDTAMDLYTARGLLMLSLKLRLILTSTVLDTDWDTPDISDTPDTSDTPDISDMDTADTSTESRLHEDLSVNQLGQKWIFISLNFPSPVLQFQCYHTKSLVMVS